jgi:hypothetical protein
MRKFITSYCFVFVVFGAGYVMGLKAPEGYVRADKAKEAIRVAHYMGQEAVILEAIR